MEIESRDSIMEWHTCSNKEVEETILHAGNTSQGVDEVLSLIIKKAWPILANKITLLFQLCLNEGYQLTVFKTAILFALLKLGNRPKYLTRSYYLIPLLSYLEKVLERILARRLARIALKFRLISLLYFVAILRQSALDTACTLPHDVERAWEQEDILTTLAFDIKDAFDEVSKERLTERLWKQKIPLSLIR